MNTRIASSLCFFIFSFAFLHASPPSTDEATAATITFQGVFPQNTEDEEPTKVLYSATLQHKLNISPEGFKQSTHLDIRFLQGEPKAIKLFLQGDGSIDTIEGQALKSWSIRRHESSLKQTVVIELIDDFKATQAQFEILSSTTFEALPHTITPLALFPINDELYEGSLHIEAHESLALTVQESNGLFPVHSPDDSQLPHPHHYRFSRSPYILKLALTEADIQPNEITDYKLTANIQSDIASFTLTATAHIKNKQNVKVRILSGDAALTHIDPIEHATLLHEKEAYYLHFKQTGTYPIRFTFNAKIDHEHRAHGIQFNTFTSAIRPLKIEGLPQGTSIYIPHSVPVVWKGGAFYTHLAATGPIKIGWKFKKHTSNGKLFYSAEGIEDIYVGAGILRQTHRLNIHITQGALSTIPLQLIGDGEVTNVEGKGILNWKLKPSDTPEARTLLIQFNQAQNKQITLQIVTQTPLASFPTRTAMTRIIPHEAIRYGGHLRIIHESSVRIEPEALVGLSQISPTLFPQSKHLRSFDPKKERMLAYRFSSNEHSLAMQVDNVLPEVALSQILHYTISETSSTLQADIELDIREAPLRELDLIIPANYAVSRINIHSLSDYFVQAQDNGTSNVRLLFGQPLSGRHILRLQLEANERFTSGPWTVPTISIPIAKTTRGHVGLSASAGIRLTSSTFDQAIETATAFFPKRIEGLQLAYRLRNANWTINIQRGHLPRTIQVDAFHLYTVGEDAVYHSSILNYLISGAPVSIFKIDTPKSYANIEFTGQDIREWKTTDTGYEVRLHSPVSGSYTLLMTSETRFEAGKTELDFGGVVPLNAASDQGNVVLVSHFPLSIDEEQLDGAVIPIDIEQIPADYRLLFDAPVLSAYQYTTRPFTAKLRLSPYADISMTNQIVDRSSVETHISATGEVLTQALYYVKSKGYSHLGMTIPEGMRLWTAHIDGELVTAISDKNEGTLLPIKQNTDPNKLIKIELKFASVHSQSDRMQLSLPAMHAPVLHTLWTITPDTGHQLEYIEGDLIPAHQPVVTNGLDWLNAFFKNPFHPSAFVFWMAVSSLIAILVFIRLMRWAKQKQSNAIMGLLVFFTVLAWIAASLAWLLLVGDAGSPPADPQTPIILNPSIQSAHNALTVTIANRPLHALGSWTQAWPSLFGLITAGAVGTLALRKQTIPAAFKRLLVAASWAFIALGLLHMQGGAVYFLWVCLIFAVFYALIPSFTSIQHMRKPTSLASLVIFILPVIGCFIPQETFAEKQSLQEQLNRFQNLETLEQAINVNGGSMHVAAQATFNAKEGDRIVLLRSPAVLNQLTYNQDALQITHERIGKEDATILEARQAGRFPIQFAYHIGIISRDGWIRGRLPVAKALTHRATIQVNQKDLTFASKDAVTITTPKEGGHTSIVFKPSYNTTISWKPRSRDTREEESVFFAELFQLAVPGPGVISNFHEVRLRLTQGQFRELSFDIPPALTITGVKAKAKHTWRFDPEKHLLTVFFKNEQSKDFNLNIFSELTTGSMPYQHTLAPITVREAESQFGFIGVATHEETFLEKAEGQGLSKINLESFPPKLITRSNLPGTQNTLKRAFRYNTDNASLSLSVRAMEPDIRMTTREVLSVSEDRSMLAVDMAIEIARAGVFQLRLALPENFDVESLSGEALSHWNLVEQTDNPPLLVIHLKQKTLGLSHFNLTLSGPGIGNSTSWNAPKILLEEASKQTGQLHVSPEQGIRFYVRNSEGLIQEDPKKLGIQQKGVLAFRLFNPQWTLNFDVERVDPWVQVNTFQNVLIREGLAKIEAEWNYTVENAGIKSLSIQLPPDAVGVRFRGKHLADYRQADGSKAGTWHIKLHRRIIGNYQLSASYEIVNKETPLIGNIVGVQASQVNVQRGYLLLRRKGRLKLETTPPLTAALQTIEWQSIPQTMRKGIDPIEVVSAYRVIHSDYQLGYQLSRQQAEKELLPAQVKSVSLATIVSETGDVLSETIIQVEPGNERFLKVQLPPQGSLWFAFVNKQSTWTWTDNQRILIPLEENSEEGELTSVVFYYSMPFSVENLKRIQDAVRGPQFNLPLEDIHWKLLLPMHWELDLSEISGNLELVKAQTPLSSFSPKTLDAYVQSEARLSSSQTEDANKLLNMGNQFLKKGQQEKARDAFEAAYNLSQSDAAFNEDARVQFFGLRQRQATVGLANRLNSIKNREEAEDKFNNIDLQSAQLNFTEQQAQQLLNANTAETNDTLNQLAERIIQQHATALTRPQAIRASLPDMGQALSFQRAVLVDRWKDLFIHLKADARVGSASSNALGVLVMLIVFFSLATWPQRERNHK